jgi:hypothetical protein
MVRPRFSLARYLSVNMILDGVCYLQVAVSLAPGVVQDSVLATQTNKIHRISKRVTDRSWRICHGTHRHAVGQSTPASSHTVAVGGEQQHVGLLVTAAAHLEDGSRF